MLLLLQGDPLTYSRNICLVPVFNEKDVDNYLIVFERMASTLKWPTEIWTFLLQCALSGKAQKAYSSLPAEASLDFDEVKAAVLSAYELALEAYHQRFRWLKKQGYQTYVEVLVKRRLFLIAEVHPVRLGILISLDS